MDIGKQALTKPQKKVETCMLSRRSAAPFGVMNRGLLN
jgi:hypothetical protein